MTEEIKKLVSRRADVTFRLTQFYLLNEDAADYSIGETYKYCYLIKYRPKKFLSTFKDGTITIDIDEVDSIFWSYRDEIPGGNGLLHEEKILIRDHNDAAQMWLRSNGRIESDRYNAIDLVRVVN
jgi:hypothetical protein